MPDTEGKIISLGKSCRFNLFCGLTDGCTFLAGVHPTPGTQLYTKYCEFVSSVIVQCKNEFECINSSEFSLVFYAQFKHPYTSVCYIRFLDEHFVFIRVVWEFRMNYSALRKTQDYAFFKPLGAV